MFASTAESRGSRMILAVATALAMLVLILGQFLASPVRANDEPATVTGGSEEQNDAALNILKFIEGTETRLPGAVFEIEGMEGTYTTDENGQICILGLPHDSEWLVREIQAPEGYEIIEGQAEQMVEVDDDGSGLCDSPDAVFYNRPAAAADDAGLNILKFVEGTRTRLPGAVFEIVGIGTYTTDENGQICILGLPHDSEWLVREIQAPEGYEIIEGQAEQMVEVDDDGSGLCDSPDAVFYNRPAEGGEEEMVTVSIMKHLCGDVTSVAEFVAIEEAAAAASDNPFAPLAATVVACPTIVLTGDVPTEGAVSGGNVDFDFSVMDEDGTQVLSVDGAFMAGQLCESDIDLVVVDNGTDDCLDTSHYSFEVVNGMVTVTETAAPAGQRFGTLRFTPGSGDEAALQGTIAQVEATGVIQLDTTTDADGNIMLHVYNFAAEGTQGGNPPSPPQRPREGTQGGTLPDTTIEAVPTHAGTVSALVLAMIVVLTAATYVTVNARRR